MITKAIYPGTFDPPTLGHLDIINRCLCFCDTLYVGVGMNLSKSSPVFSSQERVVLLDRLFQRGCKIKVVAFPGLLVDFIKNHSVNLIIRSFRTSADIDFETARANLNRQMSGVETLWIASAPQYRDLSSTLIREIGRGGRPLSDFIPQAIVKDVEERLTGG